MPRIALPRADWRAVAQELAGTHTAAAPPGLVERIHALLAQAPQEWVDHDIVLELDAGSVEVVHAVYAALRGEDRHSGQRAAAVTEAGQIISKHQQSE